LAAYQIEIMTSLVYAISDVVRTRFIGIASAGLLGAQGIGVAAFGGIAELTTAGRAIGLAGVIGTAAALGLVLGPLRTLPSRRSPGHLASPERRDPGTGGGAAGVQEASEVLPGVATRTASHGGHTITKRPSPR
jgi:hypothetical protein